MSDTEDRMSEERFWLCIIGPATEEELKMGDDTRLRYPVRDVFKNRFGRNEESCYSGWGVTREMAEHLKDELHRMQMEAGPDMHRMQAEAGTGKPASGDPDGEELAFLKRVDDVVVRTGADHGAIIAVLQGAVGTLGREIAAVRLKIEAMDKRVEALDGELRVLDRRMDSFVKETGDVLEQHKKAVMKLQYDVAVIRLEEPAKPVKAGDEEEMWVLKTPEGAYLHSIVSDCIWRLTSSLESAMMYRGSVSALTARTGLKGLETCRAVCVRRLPPGPWMEVES